MMRHQYVQHLFIASMLIFVAFSRVKSLSAAYTTPSTPVKPVFTFADSSTLLAQKKCFLTEDDEGLIGETVTCGLLKDKITKMAQLLAAVESKNIKCLIIEETLEFIDDLINKDLDGFNLICRTKCWLFLLNSKIIKNDIELGRACAEEKLVYAIYQLNSERFRRLLKEYEFRDASKVLEKKLDSKKWKNTYYAYCCGNIRLIISILAFLILNNKKDVLKNLIDVFLSSGFFMAYVKDEYLCKKLFNSMERLFKESNSKKERALLKDIWRKIKGVVEQDEVSEVCEN